MESPSHYPPESAPCRTHAFKPVSIYGGGEIKISVQTSQDRLFSHSSFSLDCEVCLLCGEIRLRLAQPGALRSLVEAREKPSREQP